MKKIKIVSIILMVFVLFAHSVSAFSNDYYSIDIPTSYAQESENSFTDEYGRNINVQIVSFSGRGKGSPYTEEGLNKLADNYANEIESLKDEAKKMLIEKNTKYGANLSEEEINEYVDSIEFLGVEKKEITTFSRNNYECFHLIVKVSMGGIITYSNQYSVASGNNIYTLTFSSDNLSDFNTYEITKAIDSFTIKNFQQPYTDGEESLGEKMFGAFFSTLIFCGIGALINKKQKRKNIEVINENKEFTEDNSIVSKNEKDNISTDKNHEISKDKELDIQSQKEENMNVVEKETVKMSLSDSNEGVIRDRTNDFNTYSEDVRIHKETDKKYCTNCGKIIEDTWAFCNYCGNKLK